MGAGAYEHLYFAVNRLCGRDIRTELDCLQQTERLSADQLEELQWERLHRLLRCAYESTPFYRRRFDELGLEPGDIRSFDDMRKIPPTDKMDLRGDRAGLVNPHFRGRVTEYGSSGSTGEPVVLRQATQALACFMAAKLRGHGWHGLSPGTAEGKIWGVPLRGREKLLTAVRNRLFNRIQFSAFDVTGDTALDAFVKMKQRKVRYLYGYSSSISTFSRLLAEREIDSAELSLQVIIATSDVLPDDQKRFLEAYWKCPVIREYGASETGIIAFECESGNLHITQENVLVEIDADGSSGESQAGEILVTPLRNMAMPLLRYRLNDRVELKEGSCSCGRALPLMGRVLGRNADMVRTADGRCLHSLIFCYVNRELLEKGQEVRFFQLIQESVDGFKLLVVPGDSGETEPFAAGVREILGNVTCQVERVDAIPLTPSGKIRYVVSHLGQKGTDRDG